MLFSQTRVPKFGYTAADPNSRLDPDIMISGSFNLFFRDEAELESVGGFALANYGAAVLPNNGGDQSQILGQGWATIGDDANEGSGNIVEFIGRSLWFTGSGDITVWVPGITANPVALGNNPANNFIPQVAVLNDTQTGYTSPFVVGLQPQDLPAVLSIGAAGGMTGTYSVQLTWFRDATKGESNASQTSNVVSLTADKVVIQFPASINTPQPRDRWRVYGTEAGFGGVGPHFFFTEIPERRVNDESGTGYNITDEVTGGTFNVFRRNPLVSGYFSSEQIGKRLRFFDGVPTLLHTATIASVGGNTFTVNGVTYGDYVTFTPAYSGALTSPAHNWNIDSFVSPSTRAIEVEWADNDLADIIPPVDAFPPNTTARFIAAIGNVMVLIGTDKGNGVAVSVPNFPESYPPRFRFNLPEPPVGVLSDPQAGFFYILGNNSITEMRYAGFTDGVAPISGSGTDTPLIPRTVSRLLGAAQQRAACQFGKEIYFFTKSKSPARITFDGRVDNAFGNRVKLDMVGWDANKVVVTYDELRGLVMYSYLNIHYMYYPAFDVWATPMFEDSLSDASDMNDQFTTSGFTLNGIIHLSGHVNEVNTTIDATNGSTTITGTMQDYYVGKKISIPGAGVAAATLNTTIVSVNVPGNSAVIANAASTSVTNASATITGFQMYTFDRDINNSEIGNGCTWRARFSFSDYGVGTMPKTVHRVKVGGKLGVSGTYALKFYRNYDILNQMGADRSFVAHGANPGLTENHIYKIVDCNNGEAELLAVQLDGVDDRAKIHWIEVSGEASGIDTNYNV